MKSKLLLIILLIIFTVLFFGLKSINNESQLKGDKQSTSISNFDDCLSSSGTVMESYPRKCRTADNRIFVEDIGNTVAKQDLIRVEKPLPNSSVESPVEILGQARGTWFFEGSFEVKLVDNQGNLLGSSIAYTDQDWMSEEFVPFSTQLEFDSVGSSGKATLIFEKSNPSDRPQLADQLSFPVNIGN